MLVPLIPLRTTMHCGDRLNVSLDNLTSTQQGMVLSAMVKLVGGDSKRITFSPTLSVLSCKLYGEKPAIATIELFGEIDRILGAKAISPVQQLADTHSLQQGTGRKKRGGAKAKQR